MLDGRELLVEFAGLVGSGDGADGDAHPLLVGAGRARSLQRLDPAGVGLGEQEQGNERNSH